MHFANFDLVKTRKVLFVTYKLLSDDGRVHGKDKVNCEEAEEIGGQVQESLNDLKFSETKIKRKDRFVALDSLTRSIGNEEKDPICVNPTLLFTRLAPIIVQGRTHEKTRQVIIKKHTSNRRGDETFRYNCRQTCG